MRAERGPSMTTARSIGSGASAERGIPGMSGREAYTKTFSPGITRIPGTERRMSISPNRQIPKTGRDFLNLPRFDPGLPKSIHEGPAVSVNLKKSKEFLPTLPLEAHNPRRHNYDRMPRHDHLIQNNMAKRPEPLRRREIKPTRESVPSIPKTLVLNPIRNEIIKQTDSQNGLSMLSSLDSKRTELSRKSLEKLQPVIAITAIGQENKQLAEASVIPSAKKEINNQVEIFNAKIDNQKRLREPNKTTTAKRREYEVDPKANEGRRKLLKGLFRKLKKEHVRVDKLPTGAEIARYVPTTPDDSLISEIVKGTKKDGSWNALVGAIGKIKSISEVAIDPLIKSLTAVRKRPKVTDPVGHDAVRLVLSGSTMHDAKKAA